MNGDNTTSRRILLHIGMPKSASTTLQSDVFASSNLWHYIGQQYDKSAQLAPRRPDEIWPLLTKESGSDWDPVELSNLIDTCPNDGKPIILSDEGCTFSSKIYPYADRGVIANRLHDLLPNAKILLVIRNQKSFLASLFGQLRRDAQIQEHDFEQWVRSLFDRHEQGISTYLDVADYWNIFSKYTSLFGEENVIAAPMETLFAEDGAKLKVVLNKLLAIDLDRIELCVTKRNSGITRAEEILMWLYRSAGGFQKIVPQKIRREALKIARSRGRALSLGMQESLKQRLSDHYYEGNVKLDTVIDGSLSEIEYY